MNHGSCCGEGGGRIVYACSKWYDSNQCCPGFSGSNGIPPGCVDCPTGPTGPCAVTKWTEQGACPCFAGVPYTDLVQTGYTYLSYNPPANSIPTQLFPVFTIDVPMNSHNALFLTIRGNLIFHMPSANIENLPDTKNQFVNESYYIELSDLGTSWMFAINVSENIPGTTINQDRVYLGYNPSINSNNNTGYIYVMVAGNAQRLRGHLIVEFTCDATDMAGPETDDLTCPVIDQTNLPTLNPNIPIITVMDQTLSPPPTFCVPSNSDIILWFNQLSFVRSNLANENGTLLLSKWKDFGSGPPMSIVSSQLGTASVTPNVVNSMPLYGLSLNGDYMTCSPGNFDCYNCFVALSLNASPSFTNDSSHQVIIPNLLGVLNPNSSIGTTLGGTRIFLFYPPEMSNMIVTPMGNVTSALPLGPTNIIILGFQVSTSSSNNNIQHSLYYNGNTVVTYGNNGAVNPNWSNSSPNIAFNGFGNNPTLPYNTIAGTSFDGIIYEVAMIYSTFNQTSFVNQYNLFSQRYSTYVATGKLDGGTTTPDIYEAVVEGFFSQYST